MLIPSKNSSEVEDSLALNRCRSGGEAYIMGRMRFFTTLSPSSSDGYTANVGAWSWAAM